MGRDRRKLTDGQKEIIWSCYLVEGPDAVAEMTGLCRATVCGWALRHGLRRSTQPVKTSEHKDRHQEMPRPLPIAKLKTGKCPGINGGCGAILRAEPACAAEGHTKTGLWDLVCASGHRFPIPVKLNFTAESAERREGK